MKKIRFSLSFLLIFISSLLFTQNKKYSYISVPDDPMQTRIYTLQNGLKVYLSVNKDEPRINTKIAVRAGGKNDPSDCTGLAHYLEHMLFKGNSKIGSKNWNKESAELKKISDLYELHKITNDALEKKKIYKQIDSISQIAASYVVPNEYDKLVSSLGASKTNAYTTNESTVYINEIPSNELEKWLMLESTRFSELTLRLFHTELEAVYEEYNRMMDRDFARAYLTFNELMFENHPYGTQPTIGLGEHLKNPSMEKIHEYFNTYYVPNNMAIVLVGDLNYDKTIALIDEYFGKFKSKNVPEFTFTPESPITSPKQKEILGPQSEIILLGFRLQGATSKDEPYIKLLDYMLSNSTAGLIDLNLNQKQKVLSAASFTSINKDYSSLFLYGSPKEGQTLDDVKNLLLEQIEHIKNKQFDDELIDACKKNMKLDREKGLEDNNWRSNQMIDAFIFSREWKDALELENKVLTIDQDQLIEFVKRNFTSQNYVEVKKLKGKDENIFKVEKPEITALNITRDEQSEYAKKFYSISSSNIEPVFIDYATAIETRDVRGIPVQYIKNITNSLFTFQYIFDMGTDHDQWLSMALGYADYLGTNQYTSEEFKKRLFSLGLTMSYSISREKVIISITGLQESMEKGLELLEHFYSNIVPSQEVYNEMIEDIIKSRKDAKTNKSVILQQALKNYAMYGDQSPFKDILSEEELRNASIEMLTEKIIKLFYFKHRVQYYGPATLEWLSNAIQKNHVIQSSLTEYPNQKKYPYRKISENEVFYTHFDMLQAEILFVSNSTDFDIKLIPFAYMHNQYFGSGLSSIVFQEIREAKALAYSANSTFSVPSDIKESCFNYTYIGTQADKLPEAVNAMTNLLQNMPKSPNQFNDAKQSSLKLISTERITKAGIFSSYEKAKKMNVNYDYRKNVFEEIQKLTLEDQEKFFNAFIKNKPTSYLIIGNKEKLQLNALEKLGKIKELSFEQIFGY